MIILHAFSLGQEIQHHKIVYFHYKQKKQSNRFFSFANPFSVHRNTLGTVQPCATQCAVSLQSADYWRKCHVTKYSRFAKIFWTLKRFLDCKLISIFMKVICGSMNESNLKLFSRFDKLFKSYFSKRYRFLIFFGFSKYFWIVPSRYP